MKKTKPLISFLLILSLAASLVGCTKKGAADLAESKTKETENITSSLAVLKENATQETVETETKEAEQVYKEAEKDYLLPQETFTRERLFSPEFVMIHFTSAVVLSQNDPFRYETVRSIFEDNEVSVHYIIDRNGKVRCFVPENLVAYHAGVGNWNGEEKFENKLNDYAIGIELMAIGSESDMEQYLSKAEYQSLNKNFIGFTDAQYEALEKLVSDICQRHQIPLDRDHVIGHEEYSSAKTDPGELFDWNRLIHS